MSAQSKWEIWQLHEDGMDAKTISRITGWPINIVTAVIIEYSAL